VKLEFESCTDSVAAFRVESPLDDSNLTDPPGYRPGSQTAFFCPSLTLENRGNERIEAFWPVLNSADFRCFESLRNWIETKAPIHPLDLYAFWRDHIFHATSQLPENKNPFLAFNFWGYGLCDDAGTALTILMRHLGISARLIDLNGHFVCEYQFDGKWNVIDADQNVIYPLLDNRTLASFREIAEDPFLALRCKPFGRAGIYDLAKAWTNASFFESVHPREYPVIGIDPSKNGDLAQTGWDLYPGESVTYCPGRKPGAVSGKVDLSVWAGAAESLGDIEYRVRPQARGQGEGTRRIRISVPLPAYRVVVGDNARIFDLPRDRVVREFSIEVQQEIERISIFCHGARLFFPVPHCGENRIELKSRTAGKRVKVAMELESPHLKQPPASPRIINQEAVFSYCSPEFVLDLEPGAEALWWQIAWSNDFRLVLPNLDCLIRPLGRALLSALDQTFLNPGQTYCFRAKIKRSGVWSPWSEPFPFKVEKPLPPRDLKIRTGEDGFELAWQGQEGSEYLVFASDRMDFLPEIYGEFQVDAIENMAIKAQTPNKNLIARTFENAIQFPEIMPFYRVVARKGNSCSIPSALLRANRELLALGRRKPIVLQMRHQKIASAESKMGYVDVYAAGIEPLPF